mgnify:CR=1 FL=1
MNVLKGIMKFRDIGMGCWTLLTNNDEQFEIIGGDVEGLAAELGTSDIRCTRLGLEEMFIELVGGQS